MQSRRMSLVEAGVNVLIGFVVSFAANMIVLPMFGLNVSASDAFNLGVVFTAISIARSYIVRRAFNRLHA